MKITDIFYSLQGEGALLGTPSVFIRLSGCNLRCTWCDTPHESWSPEGKMEGLGYIVTEARKNWGCRHAVITGGEPMIVDEVVLLTERLKQEEFHITIETAGTVFKPVVCDLMSISPKLSNSTPRRREGGRWAEQHERLRYQPEILKQLISNYEYQLKFVIVNPEDVREIPPILEEIGADKRRVMLMAEGTDSEAVFRRNFWLADLCKEYGYRLTPRLHVDLWGIQRGK